MEFFLEPRYHFFTERNTLPAPTQDFFLFDTCHTTRWQDLLLSHHTWWHRWNSTYRDRLSNSNFFPTFLVPFTTFLNSSFRSSPEKYFWYSLPLLRFQKVSFVPCHSLSNLPPAFSLLLISLRLFALSLSSFFCHTFFSLRHLSHLFVFLWQRAAYKTACPVKYRPFGSINMSVDRGQPVPDQLSPHRTSNRVIPLPTKNIFFVLTPFFVPLSDPRTPRSLVLLFLSPSHHNEKFELLVL